MFDRYLPVTPKIKSFAMERKWSVLWFDLGLRETAFIKYPKVTSIRRYDLRCIGISKKEM